MIDLEVEQLFLLGALMFAMAGLVGILGRVAALAMYAVMRVYYA